MVDYSKGKIYKIVVNNTEDEYRPYIGSTTKEYLSQRLTYHKSDYKKYKNGIRSLVASYNLFDKYGIENCEMVLIENYPCTTKDELHARERYWFDNMENCNICKPMRTEEEIKNKGKMDYNKRIEQDPECNKKHYQRQLELHPDTHEKNYQRQLELHPDYKEKYYVRRRELHPDLNEERKQNRYTCECGANIRREEKSRHSKSKKHLDYIATIAIQQEV